MKCEEVKLNLPAYIDGKLDEKTMAEIGRHLESCAECSEFHAGFESFLGFAGGMPAIEPPAGMKSEFLKMLDTEMPAKQKRVLMPLWLQVAAVLAIAIITYSAGYYFGTEKSRGEQQLLQAELSQTKEQVFLASLQEMTGPQKIDAVYSISQMSQTGDEVIDALVNTMNSDKNDNVRLAAINALSGMAAKNPRVKTELIRSLSVQENSLLQISLIQVLTEMGAKEARPEIEQIMNSDNADESVKKFAKDMIKVI